MFTWIFENVTWLVRKFFGSWNEPAAQPSTTTLSSSSPARSAVCNHVLGLGFMPGIFTIIWFLTEADTQQLSRTCALFRKYCSQAKERIHFLEASAFFQARQEFAAKQKAWRRTRDRLTAEELQQLDNQFYETFCHEHVPRHSSPRNSNTLASLVELYQKGASTTCFPDYELGGPNFTLVAEPLMYCMPPDRSANLLAQLKTCIDAGPAFKTNRFYVGNGGAPFSYLLLQTLGTGCRFCNHQRQEGWSLSGGERALHL